MTTLNTTPQLNTEDSLIMAQMILAGHKCCDTFIGLPWSVCAACTDNVDYLDTVTITVNRRGTISVHPADMTGSR